MNLFQATVIMSAQPNSGYELDDNSAYEEVGFRKPRKSSAAETTTT